MHRGGRGRKDEGAKGGMAEISHIKKKSTLYLLIYIVKFVSFD
jgi:hypothetical protein